MKKFILKLDFSYSRDREFVIQRSMLKKYILKSFIKKKFSPFRRWLFFRDQNMKIFIENFYFKMSILLFEGNTYWKFFRLKQIPAIRNSSLFEDHCRKTHFENVSIKNLWVPGIRGWQLYRFQYSVTLFIRNRSSILKVALCTEIKALK